MLHYRMSRIDEWQGSLNEIIIFRVPTHSGKLGKSMEFENIFQISGKSSEFGESQQKVWKK